MQQIVVVGCEFLVFAVKPQPGFRVLDVHLSQGRLRVIVGDHIQLHQTKEAVHLVPGIGGLQRETQERFRPRFNLRLHGVLGFRAF